MQELGKIKPDIFKWICLLCAIPALLPVYPAMVDVPQHAALIGGIKGIIDHSWGFADLFEIQVFTPYLFGYGLILGLSYLVGVVWATKLIIAAACVLLPLTAAHFLSAAGVASIFRWPLMVMPFGFAYDWGFLNFIVALPLGFLFLTSVLKWRGNGGARQCIVVVLWLHALFFAHLLVMGVFGVVAAILLSAPWQGIRHWIRRVAPLTSVVPAALAWMYWTSAASDQPVDAVQWVLGWHRIPQGLAMMVTSPLIMPGVASAILIFSLPFLMGYRPSRSLAAWGGFAFFILWMLFFPNYVFGNFFSYQRFATVGIPLYFLMFQGGATGKAIRRELAFCSVLVVPMSLVGWHTIRATIFDREAAGYREVMQSAEADSRLLYMALDPYSRGSAAPTFLHFAGWYQAEMGGFSELTFARFWVTPLRFRDRSVSSIELGFEWYPQYMNWERHRGHLYDYVLVRSAADQTAGMMALSHCQLRLVANSGAWWLYGRSGLEACPGTPVP